MESASLALSVPRLQKSYLLRRGTQRLPLTGGARSVRARTRTQAIEGAATDLAAVPITWQITVGALGLPFHMYFFILVHKICFNFRLVISFCPGLLHLCAIAAGVIPFVVAGIEFGKRIVSQDWNSNLVSSLAVSKSCSSIISLHDFFRNSVNFNK